MIRRGSDQELGLRQSESVWDADRGAPPDRRPVRGPVCARLAQTRAAAPSMAVPLPALLPIPGTGFPHREWARGCWGWPRQRPLAAQRAPISTRTRAADGGYTDRLRAGPRHPAVESDRGTPSGFLSVHATYMDLRRCSSARGWKARGTAMPRPDPSQGGCSHPSRQSRRGDLSAVPRSQRRSLCPSLDSMVG